MTKMNRRHFMAGLTAAAAMTVGQSWKAVAAPTDDFFKSAFHIPVNMKGKLFMGYSPGKFDVQLLTTEMNYMMRSCYALLNQPDYLNLANESSLKRVDALTSSMHIGQRSFNDSEKASQAQVLASVDYFNRQVKDMNYADRVDNIIGVLKKMFRNIDYQIHSELTEQPRTPAQLQHAAVGDCQDFTFARMVYAKAFGLRPEHMAMVMYVSKTRPQTDANGKPIEAGSHADFAIYHPKTNSWLIIDGNGRDVGAQLGSVLVCSADHQYTMENLAGDKSFLASAPPVVAVNQNGVFGFNSLKGFDDKKGWYVFNEAQPMRDTGAFIYEKILGVDGTPAARPETVIAQPQFAPGH